MHKQGLTPVTTAGAATATRIALPVALKASGFVFVTQIHVAHRFRRD